MIMHGRLYWLPRPHYWRSIGSWTGRCGKAGGGRLLLVDREAALFHAVARRLGSAVAAHRAGDFTDEALWDGPAPALQSLELAVVNAGIAGAGPIAELAFAKWRRILIHQSQWHCSHAAGHGRAGAARLSVPLRRLGSRPLRGGQKKAPGDDRVPL